MTKYFLPAFLLALGIFSANTHFAGAVSTFITSQGGTGTTTPSGILYGDNGATTALKTVEIGSGLTFSGGVLSSTGGGGISTATYPLQISGANIALAFGTTTANSWTALQQFNGNASTTQLTVTGNTYLATVGGRVGIGTTAPAYTLDVAGNINIDQYSGYKQNGATILYASTTQGSLYIGRNAGQNLIATAQQSAQNNIAIGGAALYTATSTVYSVAIGVNALRNTTVGNQPWQGNGNVAIGYSAGQANTTGFDNTFIGFQTGSANTTGSANLFIGYNVATANTSGINNIALGGRSDGLGTLRFNQTGSNNVAIGPGALNGASGVSYSNNIGIGSNAGYVVQSSNNIFIGNQTGDAVTTGASNIIIGSNVAAVSNTASGQLNIGNLLYGTNLYSGGATSSAAVAGTFGIGTSSPSTTLSVQGNGLISGNLSVAGLTATGTISLPNSSITNAMLANSSITVSNGGGLTVSGSPVSLGGTVTVALNTGNANTWTALQQFSAGASTTQLTTTGTTYLATAGGNVGIGTTTPAFKLDVYGSSRFAGDVRMDSGKNLTFYDHDGVYPTATGGFTWDLNTDSAKIYAQQPSSDNIDLVFKIADNALATDRFVYWVDEWQGETFDAYPLVMDATKVVFNYPTVYGTGAAKNMDFYIMGSSTTSLANAYFFGDASTQRIGIGSTTPAQRLSVQGNALVSGNLSVAGLTATGTISLPNSSITNAMLANSSITVSNGGGLSVSGSPVSLGGTVTVSLNTANANTWTGLQQFNGNASTTKFSAYGPSYFGGTATSTFNTLGQLSMGTSTSPWSSLTLDRGNNGFASSSITVTQYSPATSTSMTIDCRDSNTIHVALGTSATTLTLAPMVGGQTCKVIVSNPNASAGAITWATTNSQQLYWAGGTAPTQTTTANKRDVYSFVGDQMPSAATSTPATNILGAQTPGF